MTRKHLFVGTPAYRSLWLATVAMGLAMSACTTTTKLPPPAPEAVKVLVPITKPCVPAAVEPVKKPIDDRAFLGLDFVETIKGLVVSVLQSNQENLKLRAANDRPCGDGK